MEAKHTPGPWKLSTKKVNGAWVVMAETKTPDLNIRIGDIDETANAARIVACVNACKGINPEAVPELLEACKAFLLALETMTTADFSRGAERNERDRMEKAVNKAEGRA